ncbi:MAG: GH39 family glycosyl hydrolase [Puniceicoccaceae bacterium]
MTEIISLNYASETRPLPHFWAGTGMTLPHRDPRNLLLIAGIPHERTRIRLHNTEKLISVERFWEDDPVYDWSRFDEWFDLVVDFCDLPVVYEFMGSPARPDGGPWFDAEKLEGWTAFWRELPAARLQAYRRHVARVTAHLAERYGRERAATWFWQDQNEAFFPGQAAAVAAGVKDADPGFLVGVDIDPRWAITPQQVSDFAANGPNPATGGTGMPMDFLGYHIKGKPREVVDRFIDLVLGDIEAHPEYGDLVFENFECDREWIWNHEHEHRATPYYAAWKARVLNEYLHRFVLGRDRRNTRPRRFELHFDDAFLSGNWHQRCQFTVVGGQLVKRPVHNAQVLFSLLGDELLPVEGLDSDGPVGILPSRSGPTLALLLHHYDADTHAHGDAPESVELSVRELPFARGAAAHFRIDAEHGDLHALARGGASVEALLAAHEVAPVEISEVAGDRFVWRGEMSRQSLRLIVLAEDPGKPPSQVEGLRAKRYAGAPEDVYLLWKPAGRAIRTYEIETAPPDCEDWRRINPDMIATSRVHPGSPHGSLYRIRAVDFQGRPGPWSAVVAAPAPEETSMPFGGSDRRLGKED